MANKFNRQALRPLFPYFLLALGIIAAFHFMNNLGAFLDLIRQIWAIITPFFYGFLVAYIVSIPAGGIEKLLAKAKIPWVVKRKRVLSIPLVILLFLFLFTLVLNLVIPAIFQSIYLFVTNFQTHYENTLALVHQLNALDFLGFYIDIDGIMGSLQEQVQGFRLEDVFSPINTVIGGLTAFFGGVFRGFLTLISSIYILIERDKAKLYLRRLVRAFTSARVYIIVIIYAEALNRNFKRYIYTQTIDGLILGTVATIALSLMGSPYALILGIMLGVLNYIPYFGSIIGSLIAVAIVAFTQGLTMGAVSLLVLLVIQQIDGNIIQPKLMGSSFAMSPLLIIFGITIGGALAGILGMIAAIPIVAVLRDMLESIVSYYERKKKAPLVDPKEEPPS